MAKRGRFTRVLISVVFIALGIGSVIPAFKSLLALDFGGVLACSLGILMLVLGLLGLFGGSIRTCRVMAVIVCLFAAATFVMSLVGGSLSGITTYLVWSILAWVYFDLT